MARAPFKLKLKRLDFISAVDAGAQGPIANVALIKRADPGGFEATFRVAKTDESLGLVFGWAMAGSLDGGKTPHVDYQDDAIDVTSDEFIKVCAEFMEGGASADVMHDGEQDGRVVFAFPLVPEINKALGIETSTHGLAIAMKPSPETFKRFQSGELAAFSIGGVGERTALKRDGRVRKASLYTNEVDGHAHAICVYDDGSLRVEYATMAGAEYGHSHGIVRGEDGTLTILADSGHTHELAAGQPGLVVVPENTIVVVSPEVVAMRAGDARKTVVETIERNSQLLAKTIEQIDAVLCEGPRDNGIRLVTVSPSTNTASAKSRASESSLSGGGRNVQSMSTNDNQIADLTKRLERADRIVKMTGAHKTYFDTLGADDAEAFLAKSASERDAVIKAAADADPIEVEFDGQQYRKSAGAHVVALAKAAKAERERNEAHEIEKQATAHLGCLKGTADVHAFIVKALLATKNPDMIAKAFETLDGANAVMKGRTVAPGLDGSGDVNAPANAYEALTKGLTAFCKANNIDKVWTVGLDKFKATPEGAALKRAHDEALLSG